MIRRYIFSMMHRSISLLRLGALIVAGAPAFSQVIHIDAGSLADQYYSGGTACSSGSKCMPNGAVQPPTLRYGTSFSYTLPARAGMYALKLGWIDANKIAAGQRVFIVSVNGQSSAPIDLYALYGNSYGEMTIPVLATWGRIAITFAASVGNAIISTIEARPLTLQVSP